MTFKLLLQTFFWSCFVCVTRTYASPDGFSFTQPSYHCVARERALSAIVQSDVIMGMWLNNVTREVRFSILGNNRQFQASSRTYGNFIFLELRVTSLTHSTDLRVQATASGFGLTTFCTVHVEVIDLNNFQPLFPTHPYAVSIPENTKIGSVISTVKATDSDRDFKNTRFYYHLPDSTSDYFAVHPTTGVVTLTAPLNAKAQSVHSIVIQATDRRAAISGTAQPKRTTLVVSVRTVNSHDPVIVLQDPATFDIDEEKSRLYGILKVFDLDSGEQGRVNPPLITDCDIPDLLTIEPHTKIDEYRVIFVRAPTDIVGPINATIEVSDRGNPPRSSRIDISINYRDKKKLTPSFVEAPCNFTVSEISPVRTQVGFVRAELPLPRFNNVQYSILRGNDEKCFTINQNTSLISTKKPLSLSKSKKFFLVVAAVNSKETFSEKSITVVSIVVQDANDHDPIFTKHRYNASLPENAPIGSSIITVFAFDEDEGANGSVLYSLINSKNLPVKIDPFNGTIFTTAGLDMDVLSKNSFNLIVRARDSGFPFSRKSECLVAVTIVNTNDNAPEFAEVDCTVSVAIFTPIKTDVIHLEPIDIDRNPVACSLLSGPENLFEIDSKTCVVRLVSSLRNRRVGERLLLQVVASDNVHTSTPTEIDITIVESGKIEKNCRDTGAIQRFEESIRDLHLGSYKRDVILHQTSHLPNKHKPVVIPRRNNFSISIPENTKVKSKVHRIVAYDADRGYNGKLWFTIISGNEESRFWIDTQSGVISVVMPLDREQKSLYDIVVKVSDRGTPQKFTQIRVRFTLIDVNDNLPEFSQSLYSLEIPEDVFVGHRLKFRITATDCDEGENAKIRYDMMPSPHSDDFNIHPRSGVIRVSKLLDREQVPTYNLTIRATDSSTTQPLTATAQVVIRVSDINDNAPRFHKSVHRIRIAEDLPVNTVVFWLQANDPDAGENGQVRYSLTDGATNQNDRSRSRFRVDDRSGVIRLSQQLDARVQRRYNITARARDLKKLYSTCYIEVEVMPVNKNLHAPYFAFPYTKLEISESAPIGTEIGAITAIDDDRTEPERNVRYYISDGSGFGVFIIDHNSGVISSERNLDYESEQFYWLTVTAKDQASVPLSGHVFVLVQVNDVNDNTPEIASPFYIFSVLENSPAKTYVGQVQAKDRDSGPGGDVNYTMSENAYFEIDFITGDIRTKGKRNTLDRESVSADKLSFEVIVSDSGSPSLSSSVRVWINLTDVNDNSPRFSHFLKRKILLPKKNRTQIPEELTRIIAWDLDAERNGNVTYAINASKSFNIDPTTGVISSTGAFSEDHRSVLRISCTDNGENQMSSKFRLEIEWVQYPPWSIHPPVFADDNGEPILYFEHVDFSFIPEDSSHRIIRLLQASDPDSDLLWFRIVDGNDDYLFDISPDAVLYVAGNPDAEVKDLYNITIEVTDGHNHASKHLTIHIVDVNDHRPAFEATSFTTSFPENSPPNSHVIKLQATDGDASAKNRNFLYRIRGSVDPASASKFRVTPTGDIYSTVVLDGEAQREHILIVEVDDQGVPAALQSFCRLRILITDVNEFAPVFSSLTYYGRVTLKGSESFLGSDDTEEFVILAVQASDADRGRNAMISYSISKGNDQKLWKIDHTSGEISFSRGLQSDEVDRFLNFTVTASDGAKEPRSSTARVQIEIVRKDNKIPRFNAEKIKVTLMENAMPGSFVTKLTVFAEESITYDIVSGNEDQKFSINPHSGLITLDDGLDREEATSHQFNVSCTSVRGGRAEASVVVSVADINDNRPWFSTSTYTGFVKRAVSIATSSFVLNNKNQPLMVQAVDADEGKNGKLIYRIIDQREEISRRFSVDSFSGIISLQSDQDMTGRDKEYQFKIEAFDLGNPQLSSTNHATITVFVIDDNYLSGPSFRLQNYNISLYLPVAEGILVNDKPNLFFNGQEKSGNLPFIFSLYGTDSHSAFRIDSQSGKLYVKNPNVIRPGKEFDLKVRISNGRIVSTFKIFIKVFNPSHSGLLLSEDFYEAKVLENSLQVQPLVLVTVANTGLDDHFRFKILNSHPGFKIGFTSGVVSTTGIPFDREVKSTYQLLVEVVDISLSVNDVDLKRKRCVVHVTIIDVNDNAPEFDSSVYQAIVQRNASVGTMVKQIQAVDLDFGRNSRLSYSFEEERNNLFSINSSNGIITLRRSPSENRNDANITVLVRDAGTPSLKSRTMLCVLFVNQSIPIFTRLFYDDIKISEDAHPFAVVTDDVKASNSENSPLYYTIEDGDAYRQFEIDSQEGTLKTLGKLDREQSSLYRLRIRARGLQSNIFADAEVEVKVSDVNDNSPVFVKSTYRSKLQENKSPGIIVLQVEAVDADYDENGQVSYDIVDGGNSDHGYFHIDSTTGVIWTARSFDFEEKQNFSFLIRATDNGTPMRQVEVMANIEIDDVNDNAPIFDENEYEFQVNEIAQRGSVVGKVTAYDPDLCDRLQINYFLQSFEASDFLKVHPHTGVLTLKRRVGANSKKFSVQLNVTATDGLFITSVPVTLHVSRRNSEGTSFLFKKPVYNFRVAENQPEQTPVGTVAALESQSPVYNIESNTLLSDYFRISQGSGLLTTTQVIDREFMAKYLGDDKTIVFLLVSATNEKGVIALAEVYVEILDENDNPPIFDLRRYEVVIKPDVSVGKVLFKVTARDSDIGSNGEVFYSWGSQSGWVRTLLHLNRTSGVVKVGKSLKDIGASESMQFFIEAEDRGERRQSNSVSVSIMVAPDSVSIPKFNQSFCFITISENQAIGAEIYVVNASLNAGTVRYVLGKPYISIDDNETNNSVRFVPFAIDRNTGVVTLTASLDREKKDVHHVTVIAYVNESPEIVAYTQFVVVVADVNDNDPQFEVDEYRLTIPENSKTGTEIVTLRTFDRDQGQNNQMTYRFESAVDEFNEIFTINNETGRLSLIGNLDWEKQGYYDLVVNAIDGNSGDRVRRTSTCHVIIDVIDVNDNPPQFLQENFVMTIPESVPFGYVTSRFIGIKDVDKNGLDNLNVYIVDGDPGGHFTLIWKNRIKKNKTAILDLQVVRKLDRERKSSYKITLLASDGHFNSSATLQIIVADVNDNSPICSQLTYYGSIHENLPPGVFILRIHSSDADIDENGKIEYFLSGKNSHFFNLESRSGRLFTAASLDREVTSKYLLTATASDNIGQSCSCQIHINVQDVNDNQPLFAPSSLRAVLYEDKPINSFVHQLLGYDDDLGKNGSFHFSLEDRSDGQFYIEPETGVVTLQRPLDRERVSSYELPVKIIDRGVGELSTRAVLSVQVLDVNDNPPLFDKSQYFVDVYENETVGHTIAQVSARSSDTGVNAELLYAITRGNEHNKFSINPDTGEVRLVESLDYESDHNYVLKVSARDSSDNPLSNDCMLRVNVLDVNDNSPEFTSNLYQVKVAEDASPGQTFFTIIAIDRDEDGTGIVTYQLLTKNSLFNLNPISGEISVASPGLDFEKNKIHRIKVKAFDNGRPPLSSQTTVEVNVLDVNDNRPRIFVSTPPGGIAETLSCSRSAANCTVFVDENSNFSIVRGLLLVNATDADGETNAGPFRYRIKMGNERELFYLDNNNLLKTRRPLQLTNSLSVNKWQPQTQKKLVHRLFVQVQDSGHPHLTSSPDMQINIAVIKKGEHSPSLTPHRIQIVTTADSNVSQMNLTLRLYATDADVFDRERLRFSLPSYKDREDFSINPLTGAITLKSQLSAGKQEILVQVSDGSKRNVTSMPIFVSLIDDRILERSVSISFLDISSTEQYLSLYHVHLLAKLKTILQNDFDEERDFVFISLNWEDDLVQLLFSVRKPPSAAAQPAQFFSSTVLKKHLESNWKSIEKALHVRIERIEGTACDLDFCTRGRCEQIPFLDSSSPYQLLPPVTTDTFSLVTPRFNRNKACKCPSGTIGPFCTSVCSANNNPCPQGFACTKDQTEEAGFRCRSPNPPDTLMGFTGQSLVRFKIKQAKRNHPFNINLRMRTFKSNAPIFSATGLQYSTELQIVNGCLIYSFNCGDRIEEMTQNLKRLNDGLWHNVSIDITADDATLWEIKLTVDDRRTATMKSTCGFHHHGLAKIVFGGLARKARSKRNLSGRNLSSQTIVQSGFVGCIQKASLNHQRISLHPSSGVSLEYNDGVTASCSNSLIDMGACPRDRCANGGKCLPRPDGLYECDCPATYDGDRCETLNLCGPITCSNSGYCSSDGEIVRCHCNHGFTGERCEFAVACHAIGQCRNGGICSVHPSGQPMCSCSPGWTGPRCEIDVDECATTRAARSHCGGLKNCFNFDGGFACNCTAPKAEFREKACQYVLGLTEKDSLSETAQPSLLILIIVAVFAGTVFLFVVIILIVCWKKKKKKNERKYSSGSRPSQDLTPIGHFSPPRHGQQSAAPQIPQRPVDYQRSSRNQLHSVSSEEHRSPLIGLVHPQILNSTYPIQSSSECSSVHKPSYTLQDYERLRISESASSSLQLLSPSRASSSDTQGHQWNIVNSNQHEKFLSPTAAHIYGPTPYGRAGGTPNSSDSRRSFASSSVANRSHRSQRSDALTGHYNVGRRRRQKQLLQMIALKERNEKENLQIQRVLSHLVSQELAEEDLYGATDSCNSSLRSSLSQYQHDCHDPHTTANSRPSFSRPKNLSLNTSAEVMSSTENQESSCRSRNPQDSPCADVIGHSGLFSDFELQTLQEEEEDGTVATSFLPFPHKLSSTAKMYFDSHTRSPESSFQPIQKTETNSFPSFEAECINDCHHSCSSHPYFPQRLESEQLSMSSYSEGEEDEMIRCHPDSKNPSVVRSPSEQKFRKKDFNKRSKYQEK